MRKSILSHSINQKRSLLIRHLAIACMMILMSVVHTQAQSFSLTQCECQNNDSPTVEGLFGESIQVLNGGAATWTVVQAIGFYDAASTPGNLIDIAPNTVLTNNGTGMYLLEGVREDNTGWYVELSNGTTSFPVASTHTCQYPGPELIGDLGVCPESEDTYSIDAEPSRLNNIVWTLSGGGNIVSPNGGQSIDIEWGSIEGLAQIGVTGQVDAFPNQGTGKCDLNIMQDIPIASEDTTAMACNNLLNISMNNNCELAISPDMILEDPTYPSYSYEIRLRDIEQDTIIPNGVISMEYLDKTIEVAVIHECSGNSCWGNVRLEDKNIPSLICNPDVTIDCDELSSPDGTGYPVPADATVTTVREGVYIVEGFDKCTPLVMRYEDLVSSVHCDGEFSSIISRRWSIMDDAGNVDTCSSRIFIRKATLAAITFPENYDDNTGPNPSIQACSNFPTLPNGHPDPYAPGGTGAPEGMFCLNVLVDYDDVRINKCEGDVSFKLRRKWTITDLCTAEQISRTQFIVVVDKAPPVCSAPDEFEVGTEGITCGSNINVPPPIVIFECSGWDYYVSYKLRDDSGLSFIDATTQGVTRNNDGTYTINDIPGGQDTVWIVYTIEDDCGNMSQCFTEVAIIDDLPPVPVCDQNSFVGLNDDGIAWAGVLTFDDGSHDNCAVDKLEIRRMNASPCGDPLVWSDKLKFCCEDVGNETMVSLRVTDKAGNSNTCMVLVEVQDNQLPVLKNCPKDLTVNCDADLYNLTGYGFPTVEDLCGADVEEGQPIRTLDHCGKGTVLRTFIATDRSGNTASCTQTIYVQPTNPFVYNNITWPRDYEITNGCMDSGTDPDELPTRNAYPTYPEKPCSDVTHDYNDIVFQYTDGACFKILREWTVLDWCAYNGITGAGIYKHTQVIKVQNNIAPEVVKGCNPGDLEATDLGNCRSRISLTAEGSDDCSLPTSLKWNYKLDIGNDGSVEYDVNSNRIDRVIDHGTFKVTWTVTDECDNSSSCSQVFTVNDAKKPTPYCLTEIVTVIMQVTKQVEIWASDFDRNSFDNCTPQEDLRFSFSTNPNDGNRTFTCDQLTDGELREDLRIYVTDNAGNNDYCTATIRVQDNSGNCEEEITRVALGGKITNEANIVIDDINVQLDADLSEFPKMSSINQEGEYAFENLVMYTDYKLDPVKEGNYLEGVSTLDLVLIQRHILGLTDLNSPYKVIAADVNNDEKISASDLVELRKLILGIYNELPNNQSWKFVDAGYEFANPSKPFPYLNDVIMEGLDHDEMNANFIALKVGDVNNSHETNFTNEDTDNRSAKTWVMEQNSINGLTKVTIRVAENDLAGFQFALEFDPSAYQFEGVEANTIDLNSSHLGLSKVDEGQVLISWNSNQTYDVDGELITLLLSNKSAFNNDVVAVNPGIMSPEAYNVRGEVETSSITFRTENNEFANGFELFQNIPNPFNNSTKIGFNLNKAGMVSLKVYDYSGKVLLERNGQFSKGYNAFDINANDLNASGVLYYQIDTEYHSASKKMIVIK